MSRHPFSQFWKVPVAFIIGAVFAFSISLWTTSYLFAIATLLIAVIGYGAYALGESSDLPGTTGRGGKDIPT